MRVAKDVWKVIAVVVALHAVLLAICWPVMR